MYYNLVQALKRRLILELQDSFTQHPVYQKIVPFIQNRYAFTERPQMGIVVKGSNANKVQLSADNFIGLVQSHVMLAYMGQPTFPIEWVREDFDCVKAHGGVFPTAPGVYFLEILTAPTDPGEVGTFVVDPLLTQTDEAVLLFRSGIETEAQLQKVPATGTLRLWENRRFLLKEGRDYLLKEEGKIELLMGLGPGAILTADYRYPAPSIGPVEFRWNTADFKTLPGVVMAFGKRSAPGNKVAIVVTQDRVDTAEAFGGKFESSFELDVITRDTTQVEEIADLVVMYLWSQKRARLAFEGIEITDVSMGGEAEEQYDETGDLMFYTASMTVQLMADWEVHVPIPFTISKATPATASADAAMTVQEMIQAGSGLQQASDNLFFLTHPVIAGRNNDYERIG